MMRKLFLVAAAFATTTGVALAQRQGGGIPQQCRQEIMKLCGKSRERGAIRSCMQEKMSQLSDSCTSQLKGVIAQRGAVRRTLPDVTTEFSYGSEPAQMLDMYPVAGKADAPLIVFIHGGGWSIGDKKSGAGTKPDFYNGQGFAFASLNYRLVPEVTPADQARDIALAIVWLRDNAAQHGVDPDRIYLMGHSAGAHLAALVSTDPAYLNWAGDSLGTIQGTILLDGAGYDVVKQMADQDNKAAAMYQAAFSIDPKKQAALSPISHVAAPNAPRWLILHVDTRPDSRAQSEALGNALAQKGSTVSVKPVPNSSHSSVNQDAGVAGSFVGDAITAFLRG